MISEATLATAGPDEVLILFGPRDQYVRKLRRIFGVDITHRSGRIRIAGEPAHVGAAVRTIERLRVVAREKQSLAMGDIESAAGDEGALIQGLASSDRDGSDTSADVLPAFPESGSSTSVKASGRDRKPASATAAKRGDLSRGSDEPINIQHAGRKISPRTAGQAKYVDAIRQYDLTFATGPAGCGKTYLAVATAVEALKADQVRKIVLVRPAVEAGENLGFLPGDLRAKLNPYLRPLMDALGEMVNYDQARGLMEQDIIEIIPLAYMRGRTLNDAFIILDEAQNTTVAQMKMFLTRMGERSKMVVSGDETQLDLPRGVRSGLKDALHRLGRIPEVGVIRLGAADIVRHRLVQQIVAAYEATEETREGRTPRDANS